MPLLNISLKLLRFHGLCALALLCAAGVPAVASADCVDAASPSTLVFEGVLRRKIFAGPPNFQDVRKGDRPELAYLLELDAPACARNDQFISESDKFKAVQLTYDPTTAEGKGFQAQLRGLIGKRVTVTGKNGQGAVTGHHHAPFLIEIGRIQAAPAKRP